MRASRGSPKDTWVELMEARDGEKIEDVDIFKVRSKARDRKGQRGLCYSFY